MPDEYAIGACGFSQTLRDQCRCSAFFVFRRGSTSAFSAWWASMRRLRLSLFQSAPGQRHHAGRRARLDKGVAVRVSVLSLIVHERSRDV